MVLSLIKNFFLIAKAAMMKEMLFNVNTQDSSLASHHQEIIHWNLISKIQMISQMVALNSNLNCDQFIRLD